MSYYDDSSLFLSPNGYKTSVLFAQKPMDANGQLAFTRSNDTATRVGPDGLIQKVRTSLFTYNTDFTNAAWTKQQVTAIANQIANPVNGAVDADLFYPNSTGTYRAIRRTIGASVAEVGISIYAKAGGKNILFFNDSAGARQVAFNLSAGTYVSNVSASAISMVSLGNGWYRCAFSAVTEVAYVCVSDGVGSTSVTANGTDGIYIWGQQTEYGVPTEFIGVTTTAAVSVGPVANVPRLDYLGSSCPRLILEGQRTNLMTYSESFNNADWLKLNATITPNADISPDGYTNADRIYDDAVSSQHRVGKNISVVSATTYTFSVFAKKGSLRYCYLLTSAGPAVVRYYFDLQDGVSITDGGKIEDYGSGWYRISAQVTAAATGSELFTFNLTNSSSSPTYSGTGTGYHMIYGYQVEAGSYATSYIPTLGASVTRGADAASKTGITSLIGQTEGTALLDFQFNGATESIIMDISASGFSPQNRIILYQPSGQIVQFIVLDNSVSQVSIASSSYSIGQRLKVAIAYKANNFAFYINGVQIGTDNSGSVPATSRIDIGNRQDAAYPATISVNQALLFKTRLTNAQLAELTTI